MEKIVVLENNFLYVEINPNFGGSILNFSYKKNNSKISIFRKTPKKIKNNNIKNILATSYFPLIPYSGRIKKGLLRFKKKTFKLNACPILQEENSVHGDGWKSSWKKKTVNRKSIVMQLNTKNKNWPFKYSGVQTISIVKNILKISLELKNIDNQSMPCGLGFHPFFDMTPNVTLQMKAKKNWLVNKNFLFKKKLNILPMVDFRNKKKLFNTNLVNGFSEWDGFAKIIWPEKKISLEINSSKNLKHLVVFTPTKSNFFCIEPVSHSVDSFNLHNKGIKGTGTKILKPKKTLKVFTTFKINFNQSTM